MCIINGTFQQCATVKNLKRVMHPNKQKAHLATSLRTSPGSFITPVDDYIITLVITVMLVLSEVPASLLSHPTPDPHH